MNLSHSTLFKRCMQQIMTVKDDHHWGGWNRLGKLSFPRRRVWLTDLWFGTDNLFIFPFFSIFFLIFTFNTLNFQRSRSVF
jgi:hypothetical protein